MSPGLPPTARNVRRIRWPALHGHGWLVGAGLLLIALGLGPVFLWPRATSHLVTVQAAPNTAPPVARAAVLPSSVSMVAASTPAEVASQRPQPRFGNEPASADARHIAQWALHSGDNGRRGVVVVDKKNARVFAFGADGALKGAAPALLGSAIGDHTVPGVGDKPLSQVRPEERTTPAGRFVAEAGRNANGEDIVWVDYDAAVSMHRVRPNVKAERRLERLASATPADNRISFGCINLPVSFYENVLSPLVHGTGAVVYVLPETQPAAPLFGAYPVPDSDSPPAERSPAAARP
ncbi:hypothetical protein [Acidovorax sp. BL-A-41-H1]|uniref:hypothetical protein n=1 Tax=Acidovorax sp. BL-A-41-H1 TaxID=3421102 RepID=UPI003F79351D